MFPHRAVEDAEQVESSTKGQIQTLTEENSRLQQIVSEIQVILIERNSPFSNLSSIIIFQAKHHQISLDQKKLEQEVEACEDQIEDMQTENDNLNWEVQKARKREDR